MATTLEEKIQERKKQAEERQIAHKATSVAQKIGSKNSSGTGDREKTYTFYAFSRGDFDVHHDDFPDYKGGVISIIKVGYEGELVYHKEGDDIKSYLPGTWEKLLDHFYEQITTLQQPSREESERLKKESEKKQREKAAKFGL